MSTWPDKPLIRIIDGHQARSWEVAGVLAFRSLDGDYYIPGRGRLSPGGGDRIDEWEEVTAVPTAALRDLLEAWQGTGGENLKWLRNVEDAMDPVLSCLPADKPSALDQAVTDAKNIGARGILEDFPLNDRISLLLAAVRDTHTGEDLRYRLAWVARLAYTWADLEDPSQDALEEISEHAARILTEGRVNQIDVANLTCWVGDIAAAASGEKSPRPSLIVLGARALAWAAQIIEEEDR